MKRQEFTRPSILAFAGAISLWLISKALEQHKGHFLHGIKIECNVRQAVVVKLDGTIWSWPGRMPLAEFDAEPAKLDRATNWATISAGDNYLVGIKKDGSLWAWGYNAYVVCSAVIPPKESLPHRLKSSPTL
ncbi:MAG: hypothetical protein M1608_17530 [Candidatus Omnitrophica bacterium]|nr:hypothetical protein [Candidatus Omnitrophota bacterium]